MRVDITKINRFSSLKNQQWEKKLPSFKKTKQKRQKGALLFVNKHWCALYLITTWNVKNNLQTWVWNLNYIYTCKAHVGLHYLSHINSTFSTCEYSFIDRSVYASNTLCRELHSKDNTSYIFINGINQTCPTHLRLLEEYRFLWVDTAGQQAGCHIQYVTLELRWILGLGDGVQIHNAVEDWGVLVLQGHPVLQSTQVISQVGHSSRLNPWEYTATSWSLLGKKKKEFARVGSIALWIW